MTATDKPRPVEQVSCEVCLKEVPKSAATSSEGTEYVMHFCGMECYEKWKHPYEKYDDMIKKPAGGTNKK